MRHDTRTVWKYRIQEGGETTLKGWFTKIMHVGEQDGQLTVWIENSLTRPDISGKQVPRDEEEKIEITLWAIGTGWSYPADAAGRHIGTVQMNNGLVWHVFIKDAKWLSTYAEYV